jgi:4-hydroxy-tetrahydrodipicolinate synthase
MTSQFGRVITAMVTPFDNNDNVDIETAKVLADYLMQNGSDAIVVAGTTGESPTLTRDEEYALFTAVKNTVGNRGYVIAGTGSNSTTEAIEATHKAYELGMDASLQVCPYYNKPNQDGLYNHFKMIADAVPDMPMILYNIPGRTGVNLLPETVIWLAKDSKNIVGIKEASGNIEQTLAIRQALPEFGIYSGDDSLTLSLLAAGADGVISVASHLAGNEIQSMCTKFFSGDAVGATELNVSLFNLFKVLFISTNPVPIKTALSMGGFPVGSVRPPLAELSENDYNKLYETLSGYGLVGEG